MFTHKFKEVTGALEGQAALEGAISSSTDGEVLKTLKQLDVCCCHNFTGEGFLVMRSLSVQRALKMDNAPACMDDQPAQGPEKESWPQLTGGLWQRGSITSGWSRIFGDLTLRFQRARVC